MAIRYNYSGDAGGVPEPYLHDCEMICRALGDPSVTLMDAYTMWLNYSQSVCAGWLMVGSQEEIREVLIPGYSSRQLLNEGE